MKSGCIKIKVVTRNFTLSAIILLSEMCENGSIKNAPVNQHLQETVVGNQFTTSFTHSARVLPYVF